MYTVDTDSDSDSIEDITKRVSSKGKEQGKSPPKRKKIEKDDSNMSVMEIR